MKDTAQVYMEDLLQTANAVRPCYSETYQPVAVLLDDLASSHGVEAAVHHDSLPSVGGTTGRMVPNRCHQLRQCCPSPCDWPSHPE